MYLTIIILPLLGSIISGFFGRKVGITGSQLITTFCVFLATLLSTIAFLEVGLNNIMVSVNLFDWIDSESLNVKWEFNFDALTVSMMIPVLIVSSLVHLYSWGYMSHDPHIQRFMSYLSLFTFMMLILVTGNNFLVMFVGQISLSAVYKIWFYKSSYRKLQECFISKKICRKIYTKISSETINGTPLHRGEYIVQPFMRMKDLNRVSNFKYSTLANDNLQLTPKQVEILVGILLANGSLERRKVTHNTRLRIDHTYPNQAKYVEHLYSIFENLCISEPKVLVRKPDIRTGNVYKSIQFKTKNLKCLNNYHEMFYVYSESKYVKIIPTNIDEILTARSLAHWIMGDGYLSTDKTIYVCSESLNEKEVDILIAVLKNKFNIKSTKIKRDKSGWRIRVSRKSMNDLVLLTKPYFISEFLYKLDY